MRHDLFHLSLRAGHHLVPDVLLAVQQVAGHTMTRLQVFASTIIVAAAVACIAVQTIAMNMALR